MRATTRRAALAAASVAAAAGCVLAASGAAAAATAATAAGPASRDGSVRPADVGQRSRYFRSRPYCEGARAATATRLHTSSTCFRAGNGQWYYTYID